MMLLTKKAMICCVVVVSVVVYTVIMALHRTAHTPPKDDGGQRRRLKVTRDRRLKIVIQFHAWTRKINMVSSLLHVLVASLFNSNDLVPDLRDILSPTVTLRRGGTEKRSNFLEFSPMKVVAARWNDNDDEENISERRQTCYSQQCRKNVKSGA
jgi:hypothetical protein